MRLTMTVRRVLAGSLAAAALAAGGATLAEAPASAADTRNRTYTGYILGPFDTKEQCEAARNGPNALADLTICWHDKGKWYYGGQGA
ncbi:MAG: non-hemolytic enterotoxin B [Gordonia sp. (in: high G+C Gram-positive bacteria)]|nr:MAG: non-hemolytic enterotoxin B [Gordonia sp. (in: high G+C Gram-positive bacteria)]